MSVEIVMPRLSDAMEEATVVEWLVGEGEVLTRGQPLVEIETDKATVTHEADADGVLLRIVAGAGAVVALGETIAVVGEAGEVAGEPTPRPATALPAPVSSTNGDGAALAAAPTNDATKGSVAAGAGGGGAASAALGAGGASGGGAASAALGAGGASGGCAASAALGAGAAIGARVAASPLARRVAAALGVELAGLAGSGPGGRVVRVDVERAAASQAALAPAAGSLGGAAAGSLAAPVAASLAATGTGSLAGPDDPARGASAPRPLTRTQATIARRMVESRTNVPEFELRVDVDMSACVELREKLRALGADPLPSYNDIVVKASALALREHPLVNGRFAEGAFVSHDRVNVGVAVATEGALLVPTVFDADRSSLGEIARTTRALAAKVRDGQVAPADLDGGTFTVSNLGMFGIDSFTAVVNEPQAAILAVGSLSKRAVVVGPDDDIVARPIMTLTLACDHRIVYGADGARFLARLRDLLEQPLAFML